MIDKLNRSDFLALGDSVSVKIHSNSMHPKEMLENATKQSDDKTVILLSCMVELFVPSFSSSRRLE